MKNSLINKKVIELPKEKGDFIVMEKKYFEKLKEVFKSVIEGENARINGKTRSFKDFLKKELPELCE
jgi:hypothetical protein